MVKSGQKNISGSQTSIFLCCKMIKKICKRVKIGEQKSALAARRAIFFEN
jgi:hypothetical protein